MSVENEEQDPARWVSCEKYHVSADPKKTAACIKRRFVYNIVENQVISFLKVACT